MALFEVEYTWSISGTDTQIVEASTKKEAVEVFQRNGGQHINFKKLEPQALFIESPDAKPYFSQLFVQDAGDEDAIVQDSDTSNLKLSEGYDSDR